ncbi:hypothetical protein TrRE_jg633, partial [Triparma retinervis]
MPEGKTLNTLRLLPPNFARDIMVPFPEGKLPVCQECKTICSTRDACRVSKKHVGPPWSTSWVCIVVDRTVSPDGTSNIVDGPYNVIDLNMYGFQNHFAGVFDETMPVCQHCKKTNRTKHYCRTKHTHGAVPWNASLIHVSLSDDPMKDSHPSEVKIEAGGLVLPASYTFLVEISTNVVRGRPLIIAPPGSIGAKRIRKEQNKASGGSKSKSKQKKRQSSHSSHVSIGGTNPRHAVGGHPSRSSSRSTKNIYGVSSEQSMRDRKRKKTKEIIVDANDSLENIGHLNAVHVSDKLRIHWQGSEHAPAQSVYIPAGYDPYAPPRYPPMYPQIGGGSYPGYPTFNDFNCHPNTNDVEGSNVLAEMGRTGGRYKSSSSSSSSSLVYPPPP